MQALVYKSNHLPDCCIRNISVVYTRGYSVRCIAVQYSLFHPRSCSRDSVEVSCKMLYTGMNVLVNLDRGNPPSNALEKWQEGIVFAGCTVECSSYTCNGFLSLRTFYTHRTNLWGVQETQGVLAFSRLQLTDITRHSRFHLPLLLARRQVTVPVFLFGVKCLPTIKLVQLVLASWSIRQVAIVAHNGLRGRGNICVPGTIAARRLCCR